MCVCTVHIYFIYIYIYKYKHMHVGPIYLRKLCYAYILNIFIHKLYEYKYIHVNTCTYFKNIYCICVWFYIDYGWHGMRTEPYGSLGKFQMEVFIPIPLEWGLWSEQGTFVQLFHGLKCTWQRDRSNFLIIFSWDVSETTQHGARHQIRWRTPA